VMPLLRHEPQTGSECPSSRLTFGVTDRVMKECAA
jgi:hypothetical protein